MPFGAEKKAFDRGGSVWPPRSNAMDEGSGGGPGGAVPPSSKLKAKSENHSKTFSENYRTKFDAGLSCQLK